MTLRNQLLSYFSAVILAVVALFGWNAYRIASGATERQRDALVVEHVGQLARALSVVDPEGMDAARLDAVFATSAEVGYAVAVVGPQGTAVMRKSLDPRIGEDLDQVDLAAIAGSPGAQGTLRVADHAYEWASAAIPGTPYLLVYVFPEGDGLRYSGLASRMIALALFMGWISVWVALVISTKVSDRLKAQSDEIERQATHDALTGLPNRLWILRRLEQEIARQPDSGRKLAMITMDLNRFKVINNTLGHDVGDALIQEVGKTLQDSLWESDGLARTGGDEFALLMPIRDEAHCYLLMDKIVGALEGPVVVGGITLEVSVSLGTAVYPAHGDDAASLIRCAEVAMYSAKEEGVPYAIYDPESDPNSVEHLMLISDLRQAEDLDQLELHYQPKVSVGTGRVEGVEALLRWSHPERGSVSPANFITLAEQSGAIKDLTEWVLDTAIEQAAAWRDQGHDLRVSVNLSARVLRDMDLPSTIHEILHAYGLPPDRLELEITETAIMMDPKRAMAILTTLNSFGIRLSVDDFGTGYTSLAHLKQLPVHEIKIDQAFVTNMMEDREHAVIVRAIIDLAHSMGRSVVAEGVEDRRTFEELARLGCDTIQGYYVSRPLPVCPLMDWFAAGEWKSPVVGAGEVDA